VQLSKKISLVGFFGPLENFMALFNCIWRTLWKLVVVLCAVGVPGQSFALGSSDNIEAFGLPFGSCDITMINRDFSQKAILQISDGGSSYLPNGRYISFDVIYAVQAITNSRIAGCLGTTDSNITELEMGGFVPTISYASETLYGFKFYLATDAGGLTKGYHEYKIGSGEFAITAANAPTNLSATIGDEQVSVAFTAPSDGGGAVITDYQYELDGGTWVSASTATSPVKVAGLTNGNVYSIKLRAVNSAGVGTESSPLTSHSGSPASEFEKNKKEILKVVTAEILRGVRSTISSNARMTSSARERFVLSRKQAGTNGQMVSRAATPLDIAGLAELSNGRISTRGSFLGETGNVKGGQTRLLFGDFNVYDDADGSVSAQFNAKLAWERQISTTAMYGYYLGAELGRANLEGGFSGDQDSFGASVGAYFVAEVQPNLYLDGFVSLGRGFYDLELDNGTLNVTSDYTTTTGTVGASMTGVIKGDGYEFWPQLQLTYGKTQIGVMNFTGSAYSFVDKKLSMDAGSVSMASGSFTAEFKVPLDGLSVSDSHKLFTFAPRLICERNISVGTTNDCGGGVEIGMVSRSGDGLSNLSVNIRGAIVGDTSSTGLGLKFERTF
jgi:hypothetical protein